MKALGIVIDELNDAIKGDFVFKSPCIKLILLENLLEDFGILEEFEVILDGTFNNFLFEEGKKIGGKIIKNPNEKEKIIIENFEVFKCENLSYIYDKKKMEFLDPEVKKINLIHKLNFEKFLNSKLNQLFPDHEYETLTVEEKGKVFKIVKVIPEEKEENVVYLLDKTTKDLNRIFDIIDSIEGE